MSLFRVERQYVAFESCPKDLPPGDEQPAHSGMEQEKRRGEAEAAEKQARAEQALAHAEQLLTAAQAECAQLLEQARREAAQVTGEAQHQAETLREEEKKRGYAEGRRAAETDTAEWKRQEQERFGILTRQLKDTYDGKVDALQEDIVELVMEVAEKIIGVKLEQSDEAFLQVIGEAMSRFHQSEEITVHLCGEDFRHYSSLGSIERMEQARGRKITLNMNPALKRSDCVLESEGKLVDCGVPGQLARTYELLKDEQKKEECGYGGHSAKVQGSLAEK